MEQTEQMEPPAERPAERPPTDEASSGRPGASPGASLETLLAGRRRLVIKTGSSLLVDAANWALRWEWLRCFARDVAMLHRRGFEVILVVSGAQAVGRAEMRLQARTLPLKQALAALGQVPLIRAWSEVLQGHKLRVGQVLVTFSDLEDRRSHLNLRDNFRALLAFGAIPLVNENDALVRDEHRIGDNDRLAARLAVMLEADFLFVLSDVDGLYDRHPSRHPSQGAAHFIPLIEEVRPCHFEMVARPATPLGSGGMATKLRAAAIAMAGGCSMILADGRGVHPLQSLLSGQGRYSLFRASTRPRAARKAWLAALFQVKGELFIDAGAAAALRTGKSLLPAGVKAIRGDFIRGDVVLIRLEDGTEFARGLSAYDTREAGRIAGHQTASIPELVGYAGRKYLVHANDLVLRDSASAAEPL